MDIKSPTTIREDAKDKEGAARLALLELGDEKLAQEILTNTHNEHQGSKYASKKIIRIFALLVWIADGYLITNSGIPMEESGGASAASEFFDVATLGLILLLLPDSILKKMSVYRGPIWPVEGRIGQRIDKDSPPVLFRVLGWLLLGIVLLALFVKIMFS